MNAFASIIQAIAPDHAFCVRLTIALVHLVWQGLAIAAFSLAAARLFQQKSANLRYVVHVAALVLLALCLPATYLAVDARPSSDDDVGLPLTTGSLLADRSATALNVGASTHEMEIADDHIPALEPGARSLEKSSEIGVAPARSVIGSAASPPALRVWLLRFMEPVAPYATALYFLGVLSLSLRLMLGLWGGRRLRCAATPIVDPAVLEVVGRQARNIGLRFVPVVAWCQRVSTPIVVGIITPAILLPASLAGGLAPEQLSALLTHELAHIRRFDLVVNLLQRVIETLLFFHPAVWYLSRQISREREYCCDDCVLAAGWHGTDYAQSLMRMAEVCFARQPGSTSHLVALGAAGERPSEFKRRVLRLLGVETTSTVRLSRLGVGALGLMLILALAGPPLIRSQVAAQSAPSEQARNSQNDLLDAEVQVVTPDVQGKARVVGQVIDHVGHPISGAAVFLVTKPEIVIGQGKAWWQQGDGLVEDKAFPSVISGDDGSFEFPAGWTDKTFLAVSAKTVDAWVLTPDEVLEQQIAGKAGSDKPQPLTQEKRAELLKTFAGGSVNVKIRLPKPGRLKVRYDIPGAAESTTVWIHRKLDERKWWPPIAAIRAIPLKNRGTLALNDLAPGRYFVSRTFWNERGIHYLDGGVIAIESGTLFEKNFVRKRGSPLAGIVIPPPDLTLNHLDRLSVRVSPEQATGNVDDSNELLNDVFDWVTVSSSGRFQTERLEPGIYTLVATSHLRRPETNDGKSGSTQPEFISVAKFIVPDAGALPEARIELRPRKLDAVAEGNPQPGAGKANQVERPGLRIHGRVLDAATGKPVDECRVIPTSVYREETQQYTWQPQYRKKFDGGSYEWKTDRPWDITRLRIEAPGYRPAVSRVIRRAEGEVEIDIKLMPDEGITGVVLTPDGQPAAEAQLALATWTFDVQVREGELRQQGHARDLGMKVVYTDEAGRFRLPPEVDPAVIVVAHETGYAEVDVPRLEAVAEKEGATDIRPEPAAKTQEMKIRLLRWGRVEGHIRAGEKPVEGAKFWVGSGYTKRSDLAQIHASEEAATDAEGRFVVERVPPGRGWCQRHVPNKEKNGSHAISGLNVSFDVPAGETVKLDLGAQGRIVVGRIPAPKELEKKIDWSKVSLRIFPRAPHIGFPGDNEMWELYGAFLKSEEGKTYNREAVEIAADGSFRIEGLPPADYQAVINVPTEAIAAKIIGQGGSVARGGGRFQISPVRRDGDDEPIDVGELRLTASPQLPKKAAIDNADTEKNGEAGALKVALSLDRNEFFLGESIAVEYEMTNAGQEPAPYGRGAYYSALRWNDGFRISAVRIDENGKAIGKSVANWPAPESHGGPVGAWQLKPGERYADVVFVTRVVKFVEPGRYRLRIENTGRDSKKPYSAGETIVTLKAPTAEQSRQVYESMKRAPRKAYDDNAMKFLADAADFETMHQPVYLPVLREFAIAKGDVDALPSLERMESLEANDVLVAALTRALDGDDVKLARACYRHLQPGLPFPNWYDEGNGDYDKPRRERSARTWKAEFVPALTRLARRLIPEVAFQIRTMNEDPKLLQKNAQPLLGEIDYIYRCVGRPEDFADCMKAYALSIELTKTLPLETHQYFRPRGSAFGFGHTVFRMMQRGAEPPAKPTHPGEAATFAIALMTKKEFRPAGWQAEVMSWLKVGPPYLAEVFLDHLPPPIPEEVLNWLPAAVASDYIDLAIAGCKIAEKHPRVEYRKPLQKLLDTAKEQYLVKFSRAAARANGLAVPPGVEE